MINVEASMARTMKSVLCVFCSRAVPFRVEFECRRRRRRRLFSLF